MKWVLIGIITITFFGLAVYSAIKEKILRLFICMVLMVLSCVIPGIFGTTTTSTELDSSWDLQIQPDSFLVSVQKIDADVEFEGRSANGEIHTQETVNYWYRNQEKGIWVPHSVPSKVSTMCELEEGKAPFVRVYRDANQDIIVNTFLYKTTSVGETYYTYRFEFHVLDENGRYVWENK